MELLIISIYAIYNVYKYGFYNNVVNTVGFIYPIVSIIQQIDNFSYKINFDSEITFYERYHFLISYTFKIAGYCVLLINNIIVYHIYIEIIPKNYFTYILLTLYYCVNYHFSVPDCVYYRYIHGDPLLILNRRRCHELYHDFFKIVYIIILHPYNTTISIYNKIKYWITFCSKNTPIVIKYRRVSQ